MGELKANPNRYAIGTVIESKLDKARVNKVEDVLNIGDEVEVKVTEIDEKGRVNVSRKALLPKPKKDHK